MRALVKFLLKCALAQRPNELSSTCKRLSTLGSCLTGVVDVYLPAQVSVGVTLKNI